MNIANFFHTYAGMYAAQSFCHSAVAAVVTDQALKAWKIQDPLVRQRFRLIVIFFPILSFPLYQAMDPARSSALFRIGSLFDVNRWLSIEIFGLVPISLLFLIVLGFSALVFFFQELFPVVMQALDSRNAEHAGARQDADPFIEEAAQALHMRPPDVVLIDDDDLFLFSSTGKEPVIYVSRGLRHTLTSEQMRASLAHELAHIARSRRPLLILVFLLRILMFFNPFVLIKFRRIVRDEEKICDDIAVSLTHDPAALADALKTFYQGSGNGETPSSGRMRGRDVSLEEYSHNLHLESRILRLEAGLPEKRRDWAVPFAITLATIAVVNFYIV